LTKKGSSPFTLWSHRRGSDPFPSSRDGRAEAALDRALRPAPVQPNSCASGNRRPDVFRHKQ
jgi:hypothetical protein